MTTQAETGENGGNPGDMDGFEPVRAEILPIALKLAAFEGWTGAMLDQAAREAGAAPAAVKAAFPRGVRDLLRYWSASADKAMTAAMEGPDFAAMKVREKVAFAVRARLDALRPHKEAARRAAALLALPPYVALGSSLAWDTADAIWRGLGDSSTDFNFYSKRGVLTGVWMSTLTRWLADDSGDMAAVDQFLDARIENVMQFEKAKAKLRDIGIDPAKPIGWLAKLRYPAPKSGESEKKDREERVDEALRETFPASDPPYWTSGVK